jgi:hypothetical protein
MASIYDQNKGIGHVCFHGSRYSNR